MALVNRTTQLRLRRLIRRRQKQVEAAAEAAEKQLDYNFIGRLDRLIRVRRFMLGWLALVVLVIFCTVIQTLALSPYYQTLEPAAGGIYDEGMVGTYTNSDPIYATGSVDQAVSRLIFAGLFKYNGKNQLTGDLASGYTVDATGRHYVVKLKPNLTWQDGQPLTAEDVVFTYHLIQNPNADSPLLQSWQNITITAPDPLTIDFTLPNAFAAFPYNLLTGILPEHILKDVPASQMRADDFNTVDPVGAGPFAWQAIQSSTGVDPSTATSLIALKPFAHYNGGAPKLDGFVLHVFGSQDAMVSAFQSRQIYAMSGLDSVPSNVARDGGVQITSFNSTAAMMAFFKTDDGVLADTQVRQALVQGVDTSAIINNLGYTTLPVNEPLLMGQLGYNPKYKQAGYNPAAAESILTSDGWVMGSNGVRSKNGQPLAFSIYTQDTPENNQVMQQLVKYWAVLGADVTPVSQSATDFQSTLAFHTYDALLYGISIGVDPDVYAYWDSSQADVRSASQLNFSEYKNSAADESLEEGRTRIDPALRVIKYVPFLEAWQTDAPALGLYQPRIIYVTRGPVYGLTTQTLNVDSDRYYSVANWEFRTVEVTDQRSGL
jgi:peptide/nickel transport system substrate-binding protein